MKITADYTVRTTVSVWTKDNHSGEISWTNDPNGQGRMTADGLTLQAHPVAIQALAAALCELFPG